MNVCIDHSGKVIDARYHLIRLINKGGMGAVYLARHATIGRELAVKVLHTAFKDNAEMITRFFREAQSAAMVKHRNVVDVFDMGVTEWGEPYLVMEYLEGESLAGILRKLGRPLSPAAVSSVVVPMLSALQAMHDHGIIHRDIKPDNIVIVSQSRAIPEVKLIDFGISKINASDMSQITREGSFLGTLDYMAPEQLRGDPDVRPNIDIWAVGIVCYQMLAGALPYAGDSFNALYAKILSEEPMPPMEAYPDFPPDMLPIVSRALERDPEKRYQTAVEMLGDVEKIATSEERGHALDEMLAAARSTNGHPQPAPASSLTSQTAAGALSSASVSAGGPRAGSSGALPNVSQAVVKTPNSWPISAVTRQGSTSKAKLGIGLAIVGIGLTIALVVALRPSRKTPSQVAQHITIESNSARIDDHRRNRAIDPVSPPDSIGAIAPASDVSKTVQMTVKGIPVGARLFVDGKEFHQNPFRVSFSTDPFVLRAEAPGYLPSTTQVTPDEDKLIEMVLERSETLVDDIDEKSSSPKERSGAPASRIESKKNRKETKSTSRPGRQLRRKFE